MANPPLNRLSIKGEIITIPSGAFFYVYVIEISQKIRGLGVPMVENRG
jgi:hypothetical protein